jgi:hypothetical protein
MSGPGGNKLGAGFVPSRMKPVETCPLVFHVLTVRKIVICAPVSSFVAVSGCFRFPSPTPAILLHYFVLLVLPTSKYVR